MYFLMIGSAYVQWRVYHKLRKVQAPEELSVRLRNSAFWYLVRAEALLLGALLIILVRQGWLFIN